MQKKFKILVSAYACCPNRGSEPGMGWNFVTGLSKFHEVHVITETIKWKESIEEYLEKFPELKINLKFYFIEKKRNKKLRKIWPPSYYWYYKIWQKKAFTLAKKLNNTENFDIIHQLNMVGYREPGYLWKIDKPFVWGPIGGLVNSPWRFLPSLGLKGMIFYTGRNLINLWQRNFLIRTKYAATRKNIVLLSATPEDQQLIKTLWNVESMMMTEVGQEKNTSISPLQNRKPKDPLRILWSGLHTPRKNLPLLLKALKSVKIPYELHVLGDGEMKKYWRKQSENLNNENFIKWHGWLWHNKAIELFCSGHVFCITSIQDLTSTVALEALSCGLPIICLDHCGFSFVVNGNCGIKIPVETPKKAAINIAKALEKLYHDEKLRQRLSAGAIERATDFSWAKKIESLNTIYNSLIEQNNYQLQNCHLEFKNN